MDILIADHSATDRQLLERALHGLGHTVRVARTGVEAAAALAKAMPDVLLVDWGLSEPNGEVLTRRLRQADDDKYVYVVFVSSRDTIDAKRAAFSDGADDYLTKPFHRDELLARLRAAHRIVDLEKRLRARVVELESALRRLEVSAAMKGALVVTTLPDGASLPISETPAPAPLPTISAWRHIDETVRCSLSEFLQGNFDRSSASIEPAFESSITMTSVASGLEITLGLAVDRASSDAIAQRLFGGPEEDAMLQDMLGEISNTAMGAIKTAFSAAGEQLTAGIPVSGRDHPLSSLARSHPWRKSRVLAHEDVSVGVTIFVRERPTTEIRARELAEGMVLAKDLKDARGTLLVTAGTRVSATLANRLMRIAPTAPVSIIETEARG